MNKQINIKNRREAIRVLRTYKEKKYSHQTIKICNVNLKVINSFLDYKIFSKNDLYVDSETLFELMQPSGSKGIHNYHHLLPEVILDTLNVIVRPYCVFYENNNKYAIITTKIVDEKDPIMVIVAVESRTNENMDANVNKLVTMFPKKNVESYIRNLNEDKILYKNDFLFIKK